MRIGIYGGAFNPVHNGHLHLAEWFLENQPLDKVIFVPTADPPHKSDSEFASKEDRLNMLAAALNGKSKFEISDIEFQRGGKSYTYYTICDMKRLYPDDSLFLIVGADQFLNFDKWYRADDILSMVTLLAGARMDDKEYRRMEKAKESMAVFKGRKVFVANLPVLPMSSDEIRSKIKKGVCAEQYLPRGVWEYIDRKGLYNV